MRPALLLILTTVAAAAADVCAMPQTASGGPEWRSWAAKVGRNYCVGNQLSGSGTAQWPAAGIAEANLRETLQMQVCCFESEQAKSAKLQFGDRQLTVSTHQEGDDSRGQDDDFPDLIE